MMNEAKLVIGIASACSIASILAVLVVVPQLYNQMSDVNARVFDGVQAFRVNTDSAWTSLMEVQVSVTPPSKPRENPFNSIFLRQKRGLPGHCNCGPPIQPQCPPGTPGPPGQKNILVFFNKSFF